MSFLFGKKSKESKEKESKEKESKESKDGKGQSGVLQRPQDAQPAPGPGMSGPAVNGLRPKERGAGFQSPPPGTSVNNSTNSIEDGNTPSPEHGPNQRSRLDSDLAVGTQSLTHV